MDEQLLFRVGLDSVHAPPALVIPPGDKAGRLAAEIPEGGEIEIAPYGCADVELTVIVCAPHTDVDYDLLVSTAPLIVDTSNALKRYQRENVIPL